MGSMDLREFLVDLGMRDDRELKFASSDCFALSVIWTNYQLYFALLHPCMPSATKETSLSNLLSSKIMKRKRSGGKRKPKMTPMVGAKEGFLNTVTLNTQDVSFLDDYDNAELYSRMETEAPQNGSNESRQQTANLSRNARSKMTKSPGGLVASSIKPSSNTRIETDAPQNGNSESRQHTANLLKNARGKITKSSRGLATSSIKPSNDTEVVQGGRTHQKDPKLPKSSRGSASSSIKANSKTELVQGGRRTHQKDPKSTLQDPLYKEQELKAALANLVLPLNACGRIEEHEEGNAEEETLEKQVRKSGYITNKMDNTWMDFNHMKGSLKLKPLTQIFRSRSKKKKEEFRLHTAKLHAALSLTQLAAAIAGFATSGTSTEAQQDHIEHITSSRASTLALWDQDAGVVVASAAALLTTVCAEAAESLGAKRAHVASAVKSGLATQTPVDMVTLTATAATCLKGAATLKSRAKAGTDLPRNQELLRVGAQISIVMPSDMIINVIEESKDIKGIYSLILKTNKGIAKLLFEDEKQSSIWVSTISNLLQMHNSC
ncbi:hypothetical protein TEA_022489 [Camellia sinensis var. sinensis]|uniref:VAN3-binding protein-like auxin canalisation domain-containing protein n=1 Tax=Camellia sinensis var. sinensis TaxID=542762 RepID=A0A4S4EPL1_CAMSN|nr:hypothetical protein TEA_022489 [Camellia sinensis var. sinensis]